MRARVEGAALPQRAQRARLGEAIRELIAAASTTEAHDDDLADSAERISRLASSLGSSPTRWPSESFAESAPGADMFVTHPLIGTANPLAPPLTVEIGDDGVVRARATYGAAYEGLPGQVYGGFIATAFDGMAIFASVAGGHVGVTGSLSVRFERTTPIGVEVTYRSSLERVEGRKGFVTAQLLDDQGNLCATAEGVIVTPRQPRFPNE